MRTHPSIPSHTGGTARTLFFTLVVLCVLSVRAALGQVVASVEVTPGVPLKVSHFGHVAVADDKPDNASATNEAAAITAATELDAVEVFGRPQKAKSHSKMFATDPVVEEVVHGEDYNGVLELASQTNKAAIVMLYSAWCPHCFSYRKTFSRLAADLKDKFHFAALNCMEDDDLLEICSALGVFALPSIKLFVPAALHRKLPAADRQKKPMGSSVGHLFLEVSGRHDGGLLDSFDESSRIPMAIHSLALPSQDIFLAVQYAAKQTLQRISKSDMPLTLEGDLAAFEYLKNKPCEASRWESEDVPSALSHGLRKPRDANADKAAEALAHARVHDAVRGLQFILSSWVVTVSERLTKADEFALIDLLEVARAVVPLKSVKKAAAHAILHLYHSTRAEVTLHKPQTRNTRIEPFSDEFRLYNELDDALHAVKGMKAAEWRKWIGGIPFGEFAPALAPLEEPKLEHCTTVTCSVWMLLHLMAEGAAELAQQVSVHPKCGPEEVFYKRKAQALPIYLLREQEAKGREINLDEIFRISSMDTADLIHHNPSLGCMIVPSFDLAYTIFNCLRRFFGCAACRHHFRVHFSRRSHGLQELLPPEGEYAISPPFSSAATASKGLSLLENYRSQAKGDTDAWSNRNVEKNKLDKLKLWLWRLHNSVTVRRAADTTLAFVKGDKTAGNYANCDTRWPPKTSCNDCRTGTTPSSGFISVPLLVARDSERELSIEDEINDFNEKEILAFLRKSYWPLVFLRK